MSLKLRESFNCGDANDSDNDIEYDDDYEDDAS